MRDPKTCEHWEMAFFVASTDTIFVRCMACKTRAVVKPDGASIFTTNRAKMELNKKRDEQPVQAETV